MNKWSFWKGTLKATKNLSAASTHKEIGLFRNFSFSYRCFSSQLIHPTEAGVQRQTNLGPKQGPVSSSLFSQAYLPFKRWACPERKQSYCVNIHIFEGGRRHPFEPWHSNSVCPASLSDWAAETLPLKAQPVRPTTWPSWAEPKPGKQNEDTHFFF